MATRTRPIPSVSRFVTLCGATALLGLGLSAAPNAAHAQTVPAGGQADASSQGHARVAGRVFAAGNGKPLAFATVEITDLGRSTITDEQGNFVFEHIPVGEHPLRARLVGYQVHSRPINTQNPSAIEVRLTEDPVLLAGIRVSSSRFTRRMNALPYAARALGRRDVQGSAAMDAFQFVRSNVMSYPCGNSMNTFCILSRGTPVAPRVYLDDAPAPGGVEMLQLIPRDEINRVEIIQHGTMIRVYTERFVEWAARTNYRPMPIGVQ